MKRAPTQLKLWQLLLVLAVITSGLALLPQNVGVPIFFALEGIVIVAGGILLVAGMCKGKAAKGEDRRKLKN